jgi:hypothetical protein
VSRKCPKHVWEGVSSYGSGRPARRLTPSLLRSVSHLTQLGTLRAERQPSSRYSCPLVEVNLHFHIRPGSLPHPQLEPSSSTPRPKAAGIDPTGFAREIDLARIIGFSGQLAREIGGAMAREFRCNRRSRRRALASKGLLRPCDRASTGEQIAHRQHCPDRTRRAGLRAGTPPWPPSTRHNLPAQPWTIRQRSTSRSPS